MTSSNRMRYPVRQIEQAVLPLAIVHGLYNNYQFSGMQSTFCVSLYGLEEPFTDRDLKIYNACQMGVLLQPSLN